MTREELIRKITDTPKPFSVHPIMRISAEKELLEYEQKIRADAIEECMQIVKDYSSALVGTYYYNLFIDKMEQLKEQK